MSEVFLKHLISVKLKNQEFEMTEIFPLLNKLPTVITPEGQIVDKKIWEMSLLNDSNHTLNSNPMTPLGKI